jgi:hypothetical protein
MNLEPLSRPRRAISAWKSAFFRDADLGFILFARNIDTPERASR